MDMKQILKDLLRPFKNIVFTGFGFLYDFLRFYKYGGWRRGLNDPIQRNYNAVKIYHRLEKSLSFSEREPGFGWNAANELVRLLNNIRDSEKIGFQEKVAINVLRRFLDTEHDIDSHHQCCKRDASHLINQFSSEGFKGGGIDFYSRDFFNKGILKNPEDFFWTRFSVRDFSNSIVEDSVVCYAINLALKTPSVCNRQAWHVYHIMDSVLIKKVLVYQNGNRGFGHKIPCLLIITADLKAFDGGGERYQHWIDGGMFSMSLVMAFHSIGLSTCCLNWSCSGRNDLKLRRLIAIKPEHTVIMLLAVGYPNEKVRVCASERRPLTEFYTLLKG